MNGRPPRRRCSWSYRSRSNVALHPPIGTQAWLLSKAKGLRLNQSPPCGARPSGSRGDARDGGLCPGPAGLAATGSARRRGRLGRGRCRWLRGGRRRRGLRRGRGDRGRGRGRLLDRGLRSGLRAPASPPAEREPPVRGPPGPAARPGPRERVSPVPAGPPRGPPERAPPGPGATGACWRHRRRLRHRGRLDGSRRSGLGDRRHTAGRAAAGRGRGACGRPPRTEADVCVVARAFCGELTRAAAALDTFGLPGTAPPRR